MKATVADLLRSRSLFLALLLGLGLLAATIFFTRPSSILAQLNSLGPWGFLALLLSFSVSFLCNAKGWRYLLRAQGLRLPFSTVLRIGCASFAFSYLIPSFNLAGEPIRIILAAQKLGGEEEKILATVVLEKLLFFGIAVVFLLGAAATVMTQDLPPFLHQGLFSLAEAGAVLVRLCSHRSFGPPFLGPKKEISSQGLVFFAQRSPRCSLGNSSELFSPVVRIVQSFPSHNFWLGPQLLDPVPFLFLHRRETSSFAYLGEFLELSTLFSLFWFTPAGLGIAEGGYAATFSLLGLPVEEAVTFALVQRLVTLPVIVLGLFYLGRQGIVSWRRGSDG